jgi:hypothetical protein
VKVKRFRRTRTVVQTGAVALVIAALAFAGVSLISGSKSGAALVSGTNFTIASPSPGPVLYPLATTPSNLPLTFSNPLNAPISVYSLTVSFTNTFPSGCPYSELTLNGSAVSPLPSPVSAPGVTFSFTDTPFVVPAAEGTTPGTATDDLILALPENHQNQDACEGMSLALAYNASANYIDVTTSVLGSTSPNSSTAGQTITLTDTVTAAPDSNVLAGSVLFYSCTDASCSTTTALGAPVTLSGGIATTTTTPSTGGTYYYEAVYTPTDSTDFTASTSNILTQTVN